MEICPNFLIYTKLSEMIALSKIKKLFCSRKEEESQESGVSECPIKSKVWN